MEDHSIRLPTGTGQGPGVKSDIGTNKVVALVKSLHHSRQIDDCKILYCKYKNEGNGGFYFSKNRESQLSVLCLDIFPQRCSF